MFRLAPTRSVRLHAPLAALALASWVACSGDTQSRRAPVAAHVSTPVSPAASVKAAPPLPAEADRGESQAVIAAESSSPAESPPADSSPASPARALDADPAPTACVFGPAPRLLEPGGPRAEFSIHDYVAWDLPIRRELGGKEHLHCLRVGWPEGTVNNQGQPSRVARSIGPSWFRAIENTLNRVPWHHVQTLERLVIDNRPKEHGIAPYDRQSPDDARDGHTMWLHEHLFMDPNHWGHGNHGSYWSSHVNVDRVTFATLPPDHDAFSPVLLHELGHLVMYNVVNGGSAMPSTPPCAVTCGDRGTCKEISQLEREAGCISPYCMPFRFPAGTENFAEQYRFHYQSADTRQLLTHHRAGCADLLSAQDRVGAEPHPAPWELGLPGSSFRPSLWKSCQGRACKGF